VHVDIIKIITKGPSQQQCENISGSCTEKKVELITGSQREIEIQGSFDYTKILLLKNVLPPAGFILALADQELCVVKTALGCFILPQFLETNPPVIPCIYMVGVQFQHRIETFYCLFK